MRGRTGSVRGRRAPAFSQLLAVWSEITEQISDGWLKTDGSSENLITRLRSLIYEHPLLDLRITRLASNLVDRMPAGRVIPWGMGILTVTTVALAMMDIW